MALLRAALHNQPAGVLGENNSDVVYLNFAKAYGKVLTRGC
jgi:hypothetical protein